VDDRSELIEDAALMGVELPEHLLKAPDFEVIPEAWPAVEMFLRCQTQWRVSGGGVVGFDYVALHWLFDLYGVEDPRQMLADLQVIEGKIVEELSKREQ